jgi:hypothetical protein
LELVHFGRPTLVHWPTLESVRECSGVSRLNLAALGGYAGLDTPSALPFLAPTWANLPAPSWTSSDHGGVADYLWRASRVGTRTLARVHTTVATSIQSTDVNAPNL